MLPVQSHWNLRQLFMCESGEDLWQLSSWQAREMPEHLS